MGFPAIGQVLRDRTPRLYEKLHAFRQLWLPDVKNRYIPLAKAAASRLQNAGKPVRQRTMGDVRAKRKDIFFILGCNSSVDEIDEATWQKIAQYDSLGFNYWMYHPFVPTFYSLEYDRSGEINLHHEEMIRSRAQDYAETTFLVHSRAWRRGMTPWILPEFFPLNPRVLRFLFPLVVDCPHGQDLRPEHFKRTMLYRGSLNLFLHFAREVGYRKIVLVGCEMNTATAFFEHMPEAQWMFQRQNYVYGGSKEERAKKPYGGVENSKGKHSMPTAIRAINDYVFKPEGIELYVFNEKSVLYPDVPLFRFES